MVHRRSQRLDCLCHEEPVQVGRWVTVHAQANNEPKEFNTLDFELQVLNTEALGMTEEEFLVSEGKSRCCHPGQ